MSFSDKLRTLIRWGSVSRETDDTDRYPVRQVSYLGKAALVTMLEPYGFHANVPVETLTLLLNILANPDAKVGLPSSGNQRPALAKGEVAFYHPGSSAQVLLQEDAVTISAAGATIQIDAQGAITATPASGELFTVSGDLTVTGVTALGATVTSNGKDISDTHTHIGSPTAPVGSISNTGIPV